MTRLVEAFVLGNGAILTNVCLLPLYPALIAFLAGTAPTGAQRGSTRWLGLVVLAGILTVMTIVGGVLFLAQRTFGPLLSVLLPAVYGVVVALGLALAAGFNPFARVAPIGSSTSRGPVATAFLYGALLGPMTLPCTGPIVVSAFLLGAGSVGMLADAFGYFVAFGLGFGWPLVVLPLLAAPLQRRGLGWLAHNAGWLSRAAGVLLVGIGVFGFWTEVLPNLG